ncbi:MAG: hypothetical protein AB8C84_13410 [Oligoflexales bacterium]
MIDTFSKLVLLFGIPYNVYFTLEYFKRVNNPEILTAAFDKDKVSLLEKYGFMVALIFTGCSFALVPSGFLKCALPALGAGVTNALNTMNRNRRVSAFFAYSSALYLCLYYLSDFAISK